LDRGWFIHDAAEAQARVPEHAIYATSFRHTGVSFPLVWASEDRSVSAVNVTDRYVAKASPAAANRTRLLVKVLDGPGGKRVEADLAVANLGNPSLEWKDKSRGETADLNDLAAFDVVPGENYRVTAAKGDRTVRRDVLVTTNGQEVVTITLAQAASPPMPPAYVPPTVEKALSAKDARSLKKALDGFFAASPEAQARWKFPSRPEKLLLANEPAVRQAAWEAYRTAPIHSADRTEFDSHLVNFGQYQSAYTVKTVGSRPTHGWALFIAMHGGGGAPKELNDSQWRQMQSYYHDHPEAGGYLYLALRAPNDTWNGFYDDYVYPLIDNLIRQFRLFGDIDPNKVFIMGYSHGGYGAFAIGPKIPDHFAAIHASAAAPTDGETTAKTLRHTLFTAMVGERDTAYGRYERDLRFKAEVEKLRGGRDDVYPVFVTVIAGNGHTGLPDRDKIKEMYPAVRNPVPRDLSWLMTDGVVTDFFWLGVPHPAKRQEILARCGDNRFVITANAAVTEATVWFDTRLIDFRQAVAIELNGVTTKRRFSPSLRTFCATLLRRGDPELAFSAGFKVRKDEPSGPLVLVDTP
jgi:predicted esterase